MTSVHITPKADSAERRIYRTLFLTVFGIVVYLLIGRVILRRHVDLIDLVALGVSFGAWNFWTDKPAPGFDLEVDGDEIRLVQRGSVKRIVSRAHIRYVREWGGNLFRSPMMVISQRGALGTLFLGGITVPRSIPEYEQIKTQALSWLESSKNDSGGRLLG
jgi:hypothetical protein